MTYIKTVWDDRLVENPNSYTVTDNGDGTSSIIEAPGTVFVAGTPINAANLNKLEQGVEDVTNFVEKMNTNALNLLDNSNFNAGYYGKYQLSNASAVLETYSSTSCLIVKKISSSTSTLTINIPQQVADDYKPNEDFVFSIRYISSATVTIANTANVVVVDGPIILPPSPTVKTSEIKLKFSQATNLKTIVLTLTGLANDDLLIDWMCLTPGTNGGLWVPSKNELFSYINELGANTTTDLNNFKFTGRFLIPSTLISISNAPSGFELGKTSYLDVVGGDLLNGEGKLIQKLQQHGDSKIWYRSVDGSNFGSWDSSILPIATQAQAQAGTDNATLMTPLRTFQSITQNSIRSFLIPYGGASVTWYKIAEARTNSIPSNGPTGITLLVGNIAESANNIVGSAIVNFSTTNGLSFTVTELSPFPNSANTFGYIVNSSTGMTEIWIRRRDYAHNTRVVFLGGTGTWGLLQSVTTMPSGLTYVTPIKSIATQAQAQAGTDNTTLMTPLRTKQAIDNSPITRYGTATGTNALIITANPLFDNLYTGLTIKFKNTTANTGNVTANVNSKGVKSVLNNDGTQIKPGKLKANSLYEITYDGTNFYLTKGGGEESPISKVTRGSTTITNSSLSSQVTLPQFNVNKSVVKISTTTSSISVTGTSTANNVLARIVDNTTISFTRNATSINNLIVYWELIEYEDYVNVQKGISDLSTTSLAVPISTVNPDKSVIYFSYDSSTNGEYAQMTSGHINSSSEILFRRGSDNGINKVSWFVVEIA